MEVLFLIIGSLALTLSGAAVISLLPVKQRSAAALFIVILIALLSSVPIVKVLFLNSVLQFNYVLSDSLGTISVRIDPLSAWFMLIINIICINGVLYGKGYLNAYLGQKANTTLHWILFVVLQIALLWVSIAQQALVFLIAWEIMSLSTLLLLMFEHEKTETLKAGINYLTQTHISVVLLTIGFIWVYSTEGSFDFNAIESFLKHHHPFWLFLIFFLGFGIKAGFVPLHTWLPHAHPAAPSHVSGLMSGVTVKMGIYGVLRMSTYLHTDFLQIGESLVLLSLGTAFYGILNAAVHRDFKRMLAYCTIENIGIIGLGLGVGLIGKATGNPLMACIAFSAALLHTLNHALYKSMLFFTAGNIYQQTHTRDMEKLGGLIQSMPHTGVFFLTGGMAIGGLPPFNGFISKFLLYTAMLIGIKSMGISHMTLMIFSIAALALTGGISMLTFTKSFGTIFLGTPRTHLQQQPREVSLNMRLPQYFILFIMLSIAVFPQFYLSVISKIVSEFIPTDSSINLLIPPALLNSISAIGKFSILFVLLLVLIFFVKRGFSRKHIVLRDSTWGCGYAIPTPRMQYTGKSFSKSLGKLLNFIVLEKKKYREISTNDIFPKKTKHSSHYNDLFETKIFNVVIDRLLYSLNYFQFIQNGNIQMYILYGVFFIVLVFLGTIFNLI